ncbi:MAG TPA: Gfo/Idh/MocA family oxidoreductase [Nocardioides sp.]|uniref:Gfo/Idh/MocA family protein n=1 Tax=Nocardioides sp. TaxID=35761 RepID=UPI002F3F7C80
MRFGLVGTGPWAGMAHGPGLLAAEGVELVGVWGRSPEKASTLAAELGVSAYDDFKTLLSDVDAVAFAVPPPIQAELAVVAANARKHLLLDKPVAMTVADAHAVRDAATSAGVASVVFFTDRFADASRAWLREVRTTEGWRGGWLRSFSSLQEADNPFGSSPWRWENGALWDTGPHALSTLSAALGAVRSLTAVGGNGDLVTLVIRHESGASSTASLTLFAPPAATGFEAAVWGDSGVSPMPLRSDRSEAGLLAVAAQELVESARSGASHEVDVAFGARIVELLAEAQAQLDTARSS